MFVPLPGCSHGWRCKREGLFITLNADFRHATVSIDVPLGITITEEHAAPLLAFASFGEAFRYETGVFRAMRDGSVVDWGEGAEIHMLFECPMGTGSPDSLIKKAALQATHSRDIFSNIAGGMSLKDAIDGVCTISSSGC